MTNVLLALLAVVGVAIGSPTISTFAGSPGSAGNANGFGTAARFSNPTELKGHGDPNGNIHIADRSNNALRYLDVTTGQVTTRVTSGAGFRPSVVSNVDPAGNVYFGEDNSNRRIVKLTPGGSTIVLGSYTWHQYGMFFNANDGYLYATSYSLCGVNKVHTTSGSYSVYAGSSCGNNGHNVYRTSAQYQSTLGCGMSSNGDFYFTQYTYYAINKVDYTSGVSTIVAGVPGVSGYVDGAALSARLGNVYSIDVTSDGQHVYISDRSYNRIRRVTAGVVSTVGGNGGTGTVDGPALSVPLNFPWGISAHVAGKVYFLQYIGQVVSVLTEQVHSGSYANYCCQPFFDECTAIHASCTTMDLTPLQNACNADSALCTVYNAAVAAKNSCNRLANDCDALIAGC